MSDQSGAPEEEPNLSAEEPPQTGASQPGSSGEGAGETGDAGDEAVADGLALTRMELAERTADLQRLQAEFINYKRRVERDRELVRENARFAVLSPILEVMDTIDRAREHGELKGGFKAVAEQLERIVSTSGLVRFGAPGEVFDPTMHEALSHIGTSPDVETVTCQHVAKAGYRIGDRVVRAAQVLVVDPEGTADPAADAASEQPDNIDAELNGETG
ncbi:MAG: nucleotide exchange factor GrpE [Actinomycetota bacterium]|nr:nucleotide exchange factor GrpE [Actinomycetota bacterium]